MLLTDTNLVESALHWDLEYMKNNLGDGDFSVYESENYKFMYHDEKKYGDGRKDFLAPTHRKEMKFSQFVDIIKDPEKRENKR